MMNSFQGLVEGFHRALSWPMSKGPYYGLRPRPRLSPGRYVPHVSGTSIHGDHIKVRIRLPKFSAVRCESIFVKLRSSAEAVGSPEIQSVSASAYSPSFRM